MVASAGGDNGVDTARASPRSRRRSLATSGFRMWRPRQTMLSAFASIRWRSIGSRLPRNIRIDGHAENMAHVMLDIDQFDQTEARLVRVEEQSDAAVRLRRATRRASGSVHHRPTPAADFSPCKCIRILPFGFVSTHAALALRFPPGDPRTGARPAGSPIPGARHDRVVTPY